MSNERKSLRLFLVILMAGLLLLGIFASLGFAPVYSPPGYRQITVTGGTPIAADTNYSGEVGGGYQYVDMYYNIDQTTVNTLDLELEVSQDGSTWVNHNDNAVLLNDNAADASGYVDSTPLHLYQWRIVANLTNTNTVTPTIKVVMR